MSFPTVSQNKMKWFVLSAVYGRELKVLELLEKQGFRAFVPMQEVVKTDDSGKKKRQREPVTKNWVFVQAVQKDLDAFKRFAEIKYGWKVCYLTETRHVPALHLVASTPSSKRVPMVEKRVILTIRDEDMERFIRFCEEMADDVKYYAPSEVDLHRGDRVRIIGGTLNGMEGVFVKVQGKRSRRFVVDIPNMLVATTASIEPEFIQIIEKKSRKQE